MSYGEPRYSGDGEFLGHIGLSPDITDRKEAELRLKDSENKLKILNENLESIVIQRTEQVRSLSAALTFAEQRERKRFSYVLHEELQQKLLGARILLNQHTEGHEDLDHGIALLDNAIQITRTLSLELNPPILNTEGLDAALRWLCTYMQNNYKLNVNLQIHGPVDQIRGDAQMIITNMIRELLKNVVNHSGVLKAAVDVTCEHHLIKAIVKDEGKGFDEKKELKKTSEETGFGLFSVRERLNMFGGELQVDSEIGRGTVCTIIYPLTKC
jgi:signal transduction histidine kinase